MRCKTNNNDLFFWIKILVFVTLVIVLGVFLGYGLSFAQIKDLLAPLVTIVSLLLGALGVWITLLQPKVDIGSEDSQDIFKNNATALFYLKFFGMSSLLFIITVSLLFLLWGIVPAFVRFWGNTLLWTHIIFKCFVCSLITLIYLSVMYIALSLILPVLHIYVWQKYHERIERMSR